MAFRFASATEQPCGENADIEFHAAAGGDALTMEAEGIRNAGTGSLEQVVAAPEGTLATSESLQRGAAYIVQTRRGTAILRVIQVRRTGGGRGVPPPLRGPRAAGVDRESIAGESGPSILLTLEWRLVP